MIAIKNVGKALLVLLVSVNISGYAAAPASQAWVQQQLEQLRKELTEKIVLQKGDWVAACESGDLTSTTGCYGNVGSVAFTRLNGLLGGLTDQMDIPRESVAKSVFIQQYNGDSLLKSNDASPVISVPTGSANAMCAVFTQLGMNITGSGMLLNSADPIIPQFQPVAAGNDVPVGAGVTAGLPPSTEVHVVFFLACIGYSIDSNKPHPAALQGLLAN